MRRYSIVLVFLVLVSLLTVSSLSQSASLERRFTWPYGGRTWTLTHRFSAEHYQFFRTQPRVLVYTEYSRYIADHRDDGQLQSLIDALEQLAASAGLTAWEKLNFVIAFVQSIPYVSETCEYPRFPLEMLVEQRGDCEDAAILCAALLKQMHFDVILLAFLEEKHMALGIDVTPPSPIEGLLYRWNGSSYYYLEPTSVGWEIGQAPVNHSSQPTILPLASSFASSGRR